MLTGALLSLLAASLLAHASARARTAHAGVPPRCVSSQLSLSLPLAEGAAGKRYWILALRNMGGRPCHLYGYPGVGLLDGAGRLLPYNVERRSGTLKTIVLVPGAHAWFTLEFEEGGFCSHQTSFAGLRVYPPGSTGFLTLHHKEAACVPPSGEPHVTPVRRTFSPTAGRTGRVPRCQTRGLVLWLTRASAGAGSYYYEIGLFNATRRTCALYGYPGASAVGLDGRQIGSPAGRETTGIPKTVTLAPEHSAYTVVRVTDTFVLPSSCHSTNAAGLRIYPPGNTMSRVVPVPLHACAAAGQADMLIRAVTE